MLDRPPPLSILNHKCGYLRDENIRKTEGHHDFYMVGTVEPSPDHRLLAWSEDTTGNERYTLRIKDLSTGKEVMDPIKDTSGDVEWAADNNHFFFVTKDNQERPNKVWRHQIEKQSKAEGPTMVYEETDEAFFVGIGKSRSEQILFIECASAVTSETRFIRADQPLADFVVVLPRVNDVQYDVCHSDRHFIIVLRDKARPNSEILLAHLSDLQTSGGLSATSLQVLLSHNPEVKIESISVSRDFLVVFQRVGGLQQACVHRLPAGGAAPDSLAQGGAVIGFEEPAYSLEAGSQGDFASQVVRLQYTSLTTPNSTIDYNMATGSRSVKKVQPVLGGFDKEQYVTERKWATSHDGTMVPISIVYR